MTKSLVWHLAFLLSSIYNSGIERRSFSNHKHNMRGGERVENL